MTTHRSPTTTTQPEAVRVVGARLAAVLVLALAIAAWSAARPATAAAAAGFSVSPLLYEFNIGKGKSTTRPITIVNTYGSRTTFTLTKEDFAGSKSDPYSSPVLLGGIVNSPISGAGWLSWSDSTITLDPGETHTFNVDVNAPSNATGGHYGAVIVSSVPQRFGSNLTAVSRVAVLFMMNAGNVKPPELVINEVTTTTDGDTTIDYINKGVRAARPEATVTYIDPITGKEVSVETSNECTLTLPGSAGRCEVEGDDEGGLLRKGEVVLANDGRTAKASIPTEWSGTWSSLLLPIVGMSLFVLYFWRFRRREEEEELADEVMPPL